MAGIWRLKGSREPRKILIDAKYYTCYNRIVLKYQSLPGVAIVSQLSARSTSGTASLFTSKAALVFIILNAADIILSTLAISAGSQELNYIYTALGSPVLIAVVKLLAAGIVILVLGLFHRSRILNWLNIGMALIVSWNVMALLSWSL